MASHSIGLHDSVGVFDELVGVCDFYLIEPHRSIVHNRNAHRLCLLMFLCGSKKNEMLSRNNRDKLYLSRTKRFLKLHILFN